ncbi:MAG TPA: hypothetical protein VG413_07220 [Candidatus Dormibacteraeota bacterium]|jgi:hypothetical protein|nr:hypothetical protein [Candidatus Dormibacteraeota bacterium]
MPQRNKVIQLRPERPAAAAAAAALAADESASQMAITVRAQLSLLQGYADIMEGLSPELKKQILQVMAQKTRDLGSALQPFTDQTPAARPDIGDYRRVRERTRHLMAEYRLLLEGLHARVSEAHEHVSGPGEKHG